MLTSVIPDSSMMVLGNKRNGALLPFAAQQTQGKMLESITLKRQTQQRNNYYKYLRGVTSKRKQRNKCKPLKTLRMYL